MEAVARDIRGTIGGALSDAGKSFDALGTKAAATQSRIASALARIGRTDLSAGLKNLAAPLSAVTAGIGALGNSMVRLAAASYVFEKIGRSINAGLIAPLKELMATGETFRRFELSIAGVAGSFGRAQQIDNEILKRVPRSPYSIDDMQGLTKQAALMATLSPRLAFNTPSQSANEMSAFAKMIKKISIISGNDDLGDVAETVRLSSEGNGRTFRKMRVTQSEVAGAIGMQPGALAGNEILTLRGLQALADQLIPDASVDSFGKLFSKQIEKFHDAFRRAGRDVLENSGLYDQVTGSMQKLTEKLFAYFETPSWQQRSTSIGQSIGTVMENVGRGVLSLTRALAGVKDDGTSADTIAKTIETVAMKIAQFSDQLPQLGEKLGTGLRGIGLAIETFIDHLGEYADNSVFRNVKNFVALGKTNTSSDVYALAEKRTSATLDAFSRYGITGASASYATNQDALDTAISAMQGLPPGMTMDRLRSDYQYMAGINTKNVSSAQMKMAMGIQRGIGGMSAYTLEDPDRIARQLKLSGIDLQPSAPAPTFSPATSAGIESINNRLSGLFKIGDRGDSNLTGKLRAISAAGNSLSDFDPEHDAFSHARGLLKSGLSTLDGGFRFSGESSGGANLFQKTRDARAEILSQLDSGIASYIREAITDIDPKHQATIGAAKSELERIRAKVVEDYATALGEAQKSIVSGVGRSNVAMINGLSGDAPSSRAAIIDKIMNGTTADAAQAAKLTGLDPSAFGSNAISSDLLARSRQAQLSAHADLIGQGYDVGFESRATNNSALLAYYKSAMPAVHSDVVRAQNEFAADPTSDSALRNLANVKNVEDVLISRTRQLSYEVNFALKNFVEFGDKAQESLSQGLGASIEAIITRTGKLGDIWRNVAKSIVGSFSSSVGSTITQKLFGAGGDGGRSGIGGIIYNSLGQQGNADSGGILGSIISGLTGSGGGGAAAAALPAYGDGGIISRPTVGLLSERGSPEAVVPLGASGRSIPVQMLNGGSTNHGDTYIVSSPEQAFAIGMRTHRDSLVDVMSGDVRRGGRLHKAIKYKG
jgi:hypothetical protein